jgi:hypothetical protein
LPCFIPEDVTEVHVSITFTWDLLEGERLANAWSRIAPVKIGGPATGMRGEDFIPGRYLREGYVITSRGCPNQCWFCSVPTREGKLRELPITEGYNLLDDNLLACSEDHIRKVFAMLERCKYMGRPQFTGGLEAKRLKSQHIALLETLRPKEIFFAYDTPDDLPPLEEAAKLFQGAGYGSRSILRCYVLVGYPGDDFQAAEHRLETVLRLGIGPMAMLFRDEQGRTPALEWRRFQRAWARPAMIYSIHSKQRRYLQTT